VHAVSKATFDFMILQAQYLKHNLEQWHNEIDNWRVTQQLTNARRFESELEELKRWLQEKGYNV
jgi:hypothetical protein